MNSIDNRFNPEGSPLRNAQRRMLEILQVFDKICEIHNIRYWLSDGTLLGAVRHGGFIPWDDDVDIMMLKKDYKKFLRVANEELPENLCIQNRTNERNFINNFTKIRDRHSFIEEHQTMTKRYKERGLFIDIFPMQKTWKPLFKMAGKIHFKCYILSSQDNKHHKKSLIISWILFNIIIPIFNFISLFINEGKISHGYGAYFFEEWEDKDIFPLSSIKFEGISFKCPNNPDKYLKCQYGNYMEIPKDIHCHVYKEQIKIW